MREIDAARINCTAIIKLLRRPSVSEHADSTGRLARARLKQKMQKMTPLVRKGTEREIF